MHLLLYTNLFPSDEAPRHGIFVEERLRQLKRAGRVSASVCALRPVVSLNPLFWLRGSVSAAQHERHGVPVHYVEVPTLPLISNWIDPWLWAWASKRAVAKLVAGIDPPVILDAHFLYPDGAAAVILGRRLGLPVVVTARGSDVNLKARNPVMRRWIRWVASRSAAVVTVSVALRDKLVDLGAARDRVTALPNGVDLDRFSSGRTRDLREELDLSGALLASVGHLVEGKGHHIAIEALKTLDRASLVIVGEGPERQKLERLAVSLGVASRVRFLGLVDPDEIPGVYSACDLTVLASSNEGMPNVVLESIACGTPVVATDVGGVREVLTAPVAGSIIKERSAAALANAARVVLEAGKDREATREFARRFDWKNTVAKQLDLYEQVALV
ncbi:MAG: glycosyltransferase family 4 protein [Pseudomonadota bacterium]